MLFSVHIGIVASGDEDIVTHIRAEELQKQTNALAVAWEGAGGARAARFNNLPFIEVRGITDNARDDVPQSFSANLPVAMSNIGMVMLNLIGK